MDYGFITTTGMDKWYNGLWPFWSMLRGSESYIGLSGGKGIYVSNLPFNHYNIKHNNTNAASRFIRKSLNNLKSKGVDTITVSPALRDIKLIYEISQQLDMNYIDGHCLYMHVLPEILRILSKDKGIDLLKQEIAIAADTMLKARDILLNISNIVKYAVILGGQSRYKAADDVMDISGLAVRVSRSNSSKVLIYAGGQIYPTSTDAIIIDLTGSLSTQNQCVINAYLELNGGMPIKLISDIIDLPLLEWYINLMYDNVSLPEAYKKLNCKVKGLIYKQNEQFGNVAIR